MKASLSDFKRNSIERFRSNLRTTGSDSKSNRRVVAGTVGLNSFPVEVHGQQQGGNYNGYYRCTAYHPLVASFLVRCDYDSTREGLRLGIDLGGRRLTRFENRTVVFGGLRYWPDSVLEVRIAEERDVEDFRALLKSIARSEIESEFAMSYQLWVFGIAADGTCRFYLIIKPRPSAGTGHDKRVAFQIFEFAREFGDPVTISDEQFEKLKSKAAKMIRRDFI